MEKELFANFRHVKLIEVFKVEVNEGDGTTDDPITRIAYLVSKNGKMLAKIGEDKERKFAGNDELVKL